MSSWVELNSVWYLQTVPLLHLHVILFLQVLRSHCLPNKLNPFLAIIPILNPLKASENQWFFGVFRGYKMETVIRNGLTSKYPWLSFHVKLFINPYQPSVAFYVETRHLFWSATEMTGFYMKRNTELKWVRLNRNYQVIDLKLCLPRFFGRFFRNNDRLLNGWIMERSRHANMLAMNLQWTRTFFRFPLTTTSQVWIMGNIQMSFQESLLHHELWKAMDREETTTCLNLETWFNWNYWK